MPVKSGDTVRVHYSGTLDDGTLFDSSQGRDPLEFKVGDGQVIPGFENAVIGMEIGDRKTVTISPEDAYGSVHEQLSHTVSRADFASDPYVGGMVNLISPEGVELVGRITSVEGDEIVLDFNHPLAGERLTFEIEVAGIEAAESPIVGA